MLDYSDSRIRQRLFHGTFGLEKESLRVTQDGHMAQTPHPIRHAGIVRDFCENQPEINTRPHDSLEKALGELRELSTLLQQAAASQGELIWPFSSPCILQGEKDIPIAQFDGDLAWYTEYRRYLSGRYGRYKMTFSGIHYNFSFADELLQAAFSQSRETDWRAFKDRFYLDLACKASYYGWIISALCSASPLLDGSYFEKHLTGMTIFDGMGSIRSSELGYWNFFTPLFDYSSLAGYIRSIRRYEENGLLARSSELYYPVRLKPAGPYSMESMEQNGISHIELRMLDLNPLHPDGIELEDLKFIHLLLIWMACTPRLELDDRTQILAIQNFKSAAHFDLCNARIVYPDDSSLNVLEASAILLEELDAFFTDLPQEYQGVLERQKRKLTDPFQYRYAWILRQEYGEDYIGKGLELAGQRQREALQSAAEDHSSQKTAD